MNHQLRTNTCLVSILNWCQRRRIYLHLSNCVAMTITRKRNPLSFVCNVSEPPLKRVSSFKYLGVHMKHVTSKATASMRTTLDYADVIWNPTLPETFQSQKEYKGRLYAFHMTNTRDCFLLALSMPEPVSPLCLEAGRLTD